MATSENVRITVRQKLRNDEGKLIANPPDRVMTFTGKLTLLGDYDVGTVAITPFVGDTDLAASGGQFSAIDVLLVHCRKESANPILLGWNPAGHADDTLQSVTIDPGQTFIMPDVNSNLSAGDPIYELTQIAGVGGAAQVVFLAVGDP